MSRLAQSGYHNSPLVINSSVSDLDRGTITTLHPDAYQFTQDPGNAIAYGLVATDGINTFGLRMQPGATNVAIVGCQFLSNAPYVFELERPYVNLLMKDTTMLGAP